MSKTLASTVQLNLSLNKHEHDIYTTWHIFHFTCIYTCMYAHKNNDVDALMQSTCVCTRRVYDNLHEHTYMAVTYMSNLVSMHVDVYMNCKPRMIVQTLWTCSCTEVWLWFPSWYKTQMSLRVYCKAKAHIPYMGVCLLLIIISNSQIDSNVTN